MTTQVMLVPLLIEGFEKADVEDFLGPIIFAEILGQETMFYEEIDDRAAAIEDNDLTEFNTDQMIANANLLRGAMVRQIKMSSVYMEMIDLTHKHYIDEVQVIAPNQVLIQWRLKDE